MGIQLNKLITSYYEVTKRKDDSNDDALTAMKEFERLIVKEILDEHADELLQLENDARKKRLLEEREESIKQSMHSFSRLLLEGVALALLVGLIGSHLYGLGEAWLYAPNSSFATSFSLLILIALVFICATLIAYMFISSLPEWVANAMKKNHSE